MAASPPTWPGIIATSQVIRALGFMEGEVADDFYPSRPTKPIRLCTTR
jgi:hypothetical protein